MDKVLSFLGIAKKAGKVVTGTDAVCDKMAKGEIYFIFTALDSSAATIDKMEHKAFYYQIPFNKTYTTNELNSSIGSANIKVIGITDASFGEGFKKKINKEEM